AFENEFDSWVQETDERKEKYGHLLSRFEEIYTELEEYQVINDLLSEAIFRVEQFRIAGTIRSQMLDSIPAEVILQTAEGLFKDYYAPLDQEMLSEMLRNYRQHAEDVYYPDFYSSVDKKFKGDFAAYSEKLFSKSPFSSEASVKALVAQYENNPAKALKKIENSDIFSMYSEFRDIYNAMVIPPMAMLNQNLNEMYSIWVQGQFEMQPKVRQYPDANFTMRLTYGEIQGYKPEDAVEYDYFTTLSGVIEKSKEGKHDYVIPEKLADLYYAKDFGDYGVDGKMPVCFAASNHTSGGNSGSPVLDAEGRLIGINFDRNWHGTMSDEMYDPDMCRNIAVDIRYVLFIIDKYAGAGYLLDEMVLAGEDEEPAISKL
ncbi:MAG: S46 family peptidase, partial [Bacteroidales bacterium]|nr:S46 family peptidase [Bacteroidales bacterium]